MRSDRYKQWCASGKEGQQQIEVAFDQAVAELTQKFKIVEEGCAKELRDWLTVHIPYYFQLKFQLAGRLTIGQARDCQREIETAGAKVSKQISLLYNLESADICGKLMNGGFDHSPELHQAATDWVELKNILQRAIGWNPIDGHTTRRRNAAKTALKYLGHDIRCFWVTGGSKCLEEPKSPPLAPVIAFASGYVQFARYIYRFVGEDCEEKGVIARLKVVEDCYVSPPEEISDYQNTADFLTPLYGRPAPKKLAPKNNA